MTDYSAQQLIDDMRARFAPDKAAGLDTAIQFDLSGDKGGQYYARIQNGAVEVNQGVAPDARTTFKASADDFAAMLQGELNPMQGFMTGKIKVEGDMGLAMKLQSIFNL